MPRNEPLIPALQRQVRNAVANAGDTTGNYISAQGRSLATLARTTSNRVTAKTTPTPTPTHPNTTSKRTTTTRTTTTKVTNKKKPTTTTTKTAKSNTNTTTKKHSNSNNIQKTINRTKSQLTTASRKYVDGTGRRAGGTIADWGNSVKDWTGARGPRESTVMNPLGLQGKRAL